jgi:hypothetical protein
VAFWRPLFDLAKGDDALYSNLVAAFAQAGLPDAADEVATQFDENRLIDGGKVLETSLFVGSPGSTFRMVRYMTDEPARADLLTDTQISELVTAGQEQMSGDSRNRMAGGATLPLLRPGELSDDDRVSITEGVLRAEGIPLDEPLGPEAVMAWLSVAETANALDSPLPYPGMTAEARDLLSDPSDDVLFAATRLVLALVDLGQADSEDALTLSDHLRSSLEGRDPQQVSSLLLFGGSLAVLEAQDELPFEAAELIGAMGDRTGSCLGGFASCVRERPPDNSACNVEATRLADALRAALD